MAEEERAPVQSGDSIYYPQWRPVETKRGYVERPVLQRIEHNAHDRLGVELRYSRGDRVELDYLPQ